MNLLAPLALLLTLGLAACGGGADDRVAQARRNKGATVKALFAKSGVPYPATKLYIRAFKDEKELEVWAWNAKKYVLIQRYPIAKLSGKLGPKLREGDGQVPEGFYRIDRFNPRSQYHLSLGIDYPNARDRALKEKNPGGDIFIHGSNVSIGCLAMTDPLIEEIYLMARDAKSTIPVHIFPMRMDSAKYHSTYIVASKRLQEFWNSLRPSYMRFNLRHTLP